MLKKINHEALQALGLRVWQPRAFRHPQLITQKLLIVPQTMRINARCLVLIYSPSHIPHVLSAAEQKILTGMLSVLELPPREIMLATIYGAQPDLSLITAQIAQWQPAFVLQLAMDLPVISDGANFMCTFSPQHLAQNLHDKAQAFKTLLALRSKLHAPAVSIA